MPSLPPPPAARLVTAALPRKALLLSPSAAARRRRQRRWRRGAGRSGVCGAGAPQRRRAGGVAAIARPAAPAEVFTPPWPARPPTPTLRR